MSLVSRVRRTGTAALSGAVAASALVVATTGTTQAAQDEASTIRVRITKYHNVKMPDVMRPGVHRFVVRSTKAAGFQIVRPHAGYTKREAMRDVRVMFERPRVLKRFERNTELIAGVSSRPGEPGIMWARVPRGSYWALDTNPSRLPARKVDTFRVAGERLHGVLPGRATLRAVNEVDWAQRPKAIPGSGRLVFRNNSTDNHFLGIAKLSKGKTIADFEEWVEQLMQGNETRPPVRFDVGLDTGVVGPGRAMSLKYDLPPGKYVMVCWWPDADMDNMPHVLMGMYRGLTVR